MAQRNSSGRGGTATRTRRQAGNQTPNTPRISESDISRMRVDDLRGQLRRRGVSGISALRKPELVKTLVRAMRSEGRAGGAARGSAGPAGRPAATKKATTARKAAGGTRKAAPARAKAAPAAARKAAPAKKAAPARKTTTAAAARRTTAARKTATAKRTAPAAKKTTAAKRTAPARKTAAAKKTAPARKTAAAKKTAPAKKAARPRAAGGNQRQAPAKARQAGANERAGVRTGRSSSRSVRSSQVVTSLQDRPERPGRSLVTTNHDVIRRWAAERGAKPATITGTEREGRAGVLTFNMPGYRESSRVREITWDEWFRTFDDRRLNLIYQEQLRNGRQSNFFRTESPDRQDA